MATYVNDLRLKEIATGDESGTWGTSTNTNLELIAEAFSYGTEAITTNADTHTTTIADGASDPGRALYLKYTGTLDSACTITIGPNTVSKVWIIENGTSGSQNIILSQGSGANITIPAGDTKVVYSDGAGAGAAFFDAFANLKVTDPAQTNITSVGTLTGFTSTGIDDNATSTAITIDSSENVGIGTTSPDALLEINKGSEGEYLKVGGDNASNARSLKFTSSASSSGSNGALHTIKANSTAGEIAFANGDGTIMYLKDDGNVGIGTTSPSEDLTIASTSPQIRFEDTDASGTPYSKVSGVLGNIYIQADDGNEIADSKIDFRVDGTERMVIDSSGNVGIGTSSPNVKLHLSDSTSGSIIRLERNDTAIVAGDIYGGIEFEGQDASTNASGVRGSITGVGTSGAGAMDILFSTAAGGTTTNTERMRIDSSGNVGIGTSSPAGLLHLSETGDGTKLRITRGGLCEWDFSLGNTSTLTGVGAGALELLPQNAGTTNEFAIGLAGTTTPLFHLKNDQNYFAKKVGIEDTSPVAPLTIKGRGTFSINNTDFIMGNNLYYDSVSDRWERLSSSAGSALYQTAGTMVFYNTTAGGATGDAVTPSERMRINSAGEVLISCTSNSQNSDEGTKFVSNGRMFQVSTYSNSAQESLHMYSSGASAARFYVDWGGTIHATSTSISAISDQRLKENIVDLETGLTEVMALKPRRFDWKNGDKTNVAGFIAQEVETVLPDLIDGFKDNTIEDAKGVRMGDMIPTLVKAIQEQQTLIESLTARITTLEG